MVSVTLISILRFFLLKWTCLLCDQLSVFAFDDKISLIALNLQSLGFGFLKSDGVLGDDILQPQH